jgi:hypothetical protein
MHGTREETGWPPQRGAAGRTDSSRPAAQDAHMKKRLLITGLVLATLVLALYGVIFGTGTQPAST